MMNISIIGAGYVGLITGVGFAKLGNKVSIVDLNHDLIQKLNNNQMPFYEPDLEDYIKNPEVAENIFFYSDYESSIDKILIWFSFVFKRQLILSLAKQTQHI